MLRRWVCGCLIAKQMALPGPGHCSLTECMSSGRAGCRLPRSGRHGMHNVSTLSRSDSSEAVHTQLGQRQHLGCTTETWSRRRGRACRHMPDSKLNLTAPVGCAEEDVVCQAWQVVQVDCISRIDAHRAPRHAQAEVHPLHGAGLDQLEAVGPASLQSGTGESASSSGAVAGPADQGGPCQPAARQTTACALLQQPLPPQWSTVCGASDNNADWCLCLAAGCLRYRGQLRGPPSSSCQGWAAELCSLVTHSLANNNAADEAASSPACRCGAGTCH